MNKKKRKLAQTTRPNANALRPQGHGNADDTHLLAHWTSAVKKWRSAKIWSVVASICALLWAAQQFVYPKVLDYKDGKWGGSLELTVNGAPLNSNMPTYVFFPAGQKGPEDHYLVPILFALKNDAMARAGEVTMAARFEKASKRPLLTQEFTTHSGSRVLADLVNEVNGNAQFDYAVHKIKFLTPGESFNITEAGFSYPISFDLSEPLLYSAHEGLDIQVTTLSDRERSKTWDLRYRAVIVTGQEGVSIFVKDFFAKQVALDIRRQSTTWQYLLNILFGSEVSIVGFVPDFHYLSIPKLLIPPEVPKHHQYYRFKPYVWSLLFYESAESPPVR